MKQLSRARQTDPILLALLVITVGAIVIRVVFLGSRIAHWDEGRVGYDILRYLATGLWEYRPIVHGPFLPQVNRHVFAFLGATDFTARLVVALIGGLLPLATWLYRDHLRGSELIALALFLAVDPILLYYSRFMRNDIVLVTFIFIALGCVLRTQATRRPRYLYAATIALALAFTTKGNVILYLIAIGAGLLLLLDHRLFLARNSTPSWSMVAKQRGRDILNAIWAWRGHLIVCTLLFLTIIVYFYAPRGGTVNGLDLHTALVNPALLPDLVWTATIGSADKLVSLWLLGSMQDHAYLPYFTYYVYVLGNASGALVLLAMIGFITDRYHGDHPRDLVSLAFYWGILSIIGYPIAMDIRAAWSVAHAILPLAIPAAVGVRLIYTWGSDALEDDDHISVVLTLLVLLLVAGQITGMAITTSYTNPQGQDNTLVQFGQPAGEMRLALNSIEQAAADSPDTDVLWYGEYFYLADESAADRLPVAGGTWYNRLPLPWYFAAYNASVDSVRTIQAVEQRPGETDPPVVITCTGNDECPSDSELTTLSQTLDDHARYQYLGRQSELTFVVFIHESYAPPPQNQTN